MENLIILIPVAIDNEKRQRNLDFVKKYYKNYNVSILQQDCSSYFHKAKLCNDAYKKNKDKVIFMCDVDCIVSHDNIKRGYELILNNDNTLVYPFDKVDYIDPKEYHSSIDDYSNYPVYKTIENFPKKLTLQKMLNYIVSCSSTVTNLDYNFTDNGYLKPIGFGFMIKFSAYNRVGLDNQHMLDYNFEDLERYERCKKMNFNIEHIAGTAYHMDHDNGIDWGAKVRSNKNFIKQNVFEYLKIINLNKTELESYIKTWPWIQN
jgi:hypothetical protein